ncbi:MAG: DUF899 family protein [Spirochaetaceae bacterium]|nr:DUF899 family protein [Spirochaetaceae bacterium]
MVQNEIEKLENEMCEINKKLTKLRRENPPVEVKNYRFKTFEGELSLLDLFADNDTLFLIHNMGQGCRYCTLWADGINPFIPHLENLYSVVLVSKDAPHEQRELANSRGWRFRMASHGGGEYIREQSVGSDTNSPGIVCYVRKNNKIYRKNKSVFGPGDEYCSFWNIISLAGEDDESVIPQFFYWKRPVKMDDGGVGLN